MKKLIGKIIIAVIILAAVVGIIMMNKQGGVVKEFNSLWEAYNWIKEDRPALKHTNAYYLIKKAALNGNTAYGYRWKFVGNVE